MRDVLRLLSPAVLMLALLLHGSRRHLVRQLQHASAFTPAAAVPLPSRRPFQGWWVARLTNAGVIRSTADARHWLDLPAWQGYRATRRRRGLGIAAAMLVLGAAWWAFQFRGQ
jgi:hypothetical protein